MKVGVYFSNWLVYARKHFPKDLPVNHLTHVYYAFVTIDQETGRVKFTDEWADVQMPLDLLTGKPALGAIGQLRQLRQLHPHLRLIFSIGGWGTAHLFRAIAQDQAKLAAFVTSAAALVHTHQFDGLDIDWEYPETAAEGAAYVSLLAQLRQALPSLELSVAAPGGDQRNLLDIQAMDRYLTQWNLMCYDFTGSWLSLTGHHANLFGHNGDNELNAVDVVKHYTKYVAASKLLLGMPLYGRSFKTSTPEVGEWFVKPPVETVDYKNITGPQVFDPKLVAAFTYTNSIWTTFDNQSLVEIKARYVQINDLAGGFFWDSAGDDPAASLIKVFATTQVN